jgi:hypothetical protein
MGERWETDKTKNGTKEKGEHTCSNMKERQTEENNEKLSGHTIRKKEGRR